jgi:hypothetical protein
LSKSCFMQWSWLGTRCTTISRLTPSPWSRLSLRGDRPQPGGHG